MIAVSSRVVTILRWRAMARADGRSCIISQRAGGGAQRRPAATRLSTPIYIRGFLGSGFGYLLGDLLVAMVI
jgi:hypothetical protein